MRQEVFRKACRRWHEVTCVVLLEKDEEEIDGPAVKVVMDDPDGCWVNRVGYPGYWAGQARMVEVNLGLKQPLYKLNLGARLVQQHVDAGQLNA